MESTPPLSSAYSRNIYVASLPTDYTDDQLHTLFAECGDILSSTVKRDRLSGSCKGYGFVLFANDADAVKAIMCRNGHMINKTRIQVRFARPEASAKKVVPILAQQQALQVPPLLSQAAAATFFPGSAASASAAFFPSNAASFAQQQQQQQQPFFVMMMPPQATQVFSQ